jgi:hypothetical protein
MAIQFPYKRTVRPFADGEYDPSNGLMSFVRTPSYSSDARPYIRGFLVLQREMRNLFEFIHPSDSNLVTYSEHIGILLVRACFEVETNMKAILRENGYASSNNWTMNDYKKIEGSHRLSEYEVLLPEWIGAQNTLRPFASWQNSDPLDWYRSYNLFKHDRVANLKDATFKNLVDAWSGLFVLLSAQYFLEGFAVEKETIGFAHDLDSGGFWHGIGDYLKVRFPTTWSEGEKYEFSLDAKSFTDPQFAREFPY